MDIKRNITLLMDFYELTMSNGYFINNLKDDIAVFDLFYRKNPDEAAYSIFVGLEDIINYILNLHFDDEDINYLKSITTRKEQLNENNKWNEKKFYKKRFHSG